MGKHLHEKVLNGKVLTKQPATLIELKELIKYERELDSEILANFPIQPYEQLSNYIWVEGSKPLIDYFQDIDNEKIDIVERLENVSIDSITEDNQLSITFLKDELEASGIYKFTTEYLDMLFQMGNLERPSVN